jgi:predicted XRE-type DNA-binding protein
VDGDLLASGGQEFEVKIYPIDVPELADTPGSDFDSARSASTDDKEAEGDDKRMANLDANRYDDRLLEDIKTQLQQQGFIKARVTEYLQVANPTGASLSPSHPI